MNRNGIGIIGGGNIGLELAGELGFRKERVYMYTSKVEAFKKVITVIDSDTSSSFKGELTCVTDDLNVVCQNCSILVVTLPSNVFKSFVNKLVDVILPNTDIIVLPGTGGAEFVFKPVIDKGCRLIGLQRVPAVYRLKEYGSVATISGRRKGGLHVSSIPSIENSELKSIIKRVFNMESTVLDNYLNVTLTPSNPILHTSRLYTLFNKHEIDYGYDANPLFYGSWSIESSQKLIGCDKELQSFKDVLKELNLDNVVSLLIHYESDDDIHLTNKISSINSLHDLTSPMIEKDGKYYVDLSSRYFLADFPNGLCILKAIALILRIDTPTMDEVLFWYQKISNKEFYKNKNELGKDILECNVPQNYGIYSKEQLLKFYINK